MRIECLILRIARKSEKGFRRQPEYPATRLDARKNFRMEELKGTEISDELMEGIAGGNAFIPISEKELREVMARAKHYGYTKDGFLRDIDPDFNWYDDCVRIVNDEWGSII